MKLPFLFCIIGVILTASSSVRNLPMQAHGFNELDYIGQLLVKGIDSFKIDVNALDQETCLTYSTWKKTDNKCETDDHHINICCLGLRGDTSASPRLNDYFNTTTEFVGFLNNPRYDFIWHKEKRLAIYNRTIYIAMNVQYSFVQGALTKEWLYNLVQVIKNRNLDIQLIFGGPTTINYFGNACKSKSAACDDKAKAILAYPFILQSSELIPKPAEFGSISNFNIEFPTIPKYCSSYFPNYGDNLPYFFYEISHETDVQFIVNTYMGKNCNRNPSHPDMTNIRVTSNVDIEMVQSYYPQENHFEGIKNGTNFLIDTLETDKYALFSYFDTLNGDTVVQIRSLQSAEKLPLVSQTKIPKAQYTKMSYKAPYLLLTNQSHAQIFSLTSNPSLSLQPLYSVSKPGLESDFVVYNDEAYFVQVQAQSKCPSGTLSFSLTNLNTGNLISSQCTEQIKAFNVNEIQSASLAVALDSSDSLRGVLFVTATYTTLGQVKDAIFAFSLKATLSNFYPVNSFTIKSPSSFIDMGIDPSAKIVQVDGKLFVLEAHSNGICQNGNVINNGNLFKCGVPSVNNLHYAYLQNVDYMMNYNWGLLDHFEQRIQKGKYVTACDSQIMHGKFYNGERPSGTVYRNAQGVLQALIINQFVDYDKLPFVTRLFGGATMPFNAGTPVSAVVVNSFDIVDFDLFTYLQ